MGGSCYNNTVRKKAPTKCNEHETYQILNSPIKTDYSSDKEKSNNIEQKEINFGEIIKDLKEDKNKRIQNSISLDIQNKIIEQMKNNICQINNNNISGTGFLCIIPFPDKLNQLSVLITSSQVLGNEDIKLGNRINLKFNNNISKTLYIDESRKVYTSDENNFNITIIEIKKSDEIIINTNEMLEIDNDIFKDFNFYEKYKDKSIYTIYYPKNKKIEYSINIIKNIDDKNINIEHLCSIQEGSSGSPLLNLETFKVIGINIGKHKEFEYNFGILIKEPINEFNKLMNNYENNNEMYNKNIINDQEKILNNNLYIININNKRSIVNNNRLIISKEEINKLFNKYTPLEDGIEVELNENISFNKFPIYYGELSKNENKRHGRGIMIWDNGDKYEGYWKDDKANGNGELINYNGDIYIGEWIDDKKNGHGIYKCRNGSYYEGLWKDNIQEGKGKEKWIDGTMFEGEYKKGKRCGLGIFKWPNGSIYEGNFEDNNFNGKGKYKWSDGRVYDGEWKNNKLDGKGIYTWPDGRKYEGDYKNDKKNGFGIYEWNDGKKYKGNWKNGTQDGEGELYTPKLQRWKKGLWNEGKRIKWLD